MEKGIIQEFDYMSGDDVCSTVKIYDNGKIEAINYTDVVLLTAFGLRKSEDISLNDVYELFEDRCVPRNRANINEILASAGLKGYDVIALLKLTHGAMVDDDTWIRFAYERDLTWADVNPIEKIRKLCEEKGLG